MRSDSIGSTLLARTVKFKDRLPTVGLVAGLCLFVVATMYYPGGTTDSTRTVGYSWTHNFVSALFEVRALNGAANSARYPATVSMLLLNVSIAMMYWRISTTVVSRALRKTIEIAGIGSGVYNFLVVTRMHNAMVNVGLVFSLVALVATAYMLYLQERRRLFAWGALCITLLSASAVMYYGHTLYAFLPIMQKLSFAASIGWLVAVYRVKTVQGREPILSAVAA